ncbi:ABC transporter substrate-binding protein [Tomitella biformata]|uniref:ABC transporter substrate-binding protein n=1 Tax=Tomitella biformata TaxID=630403 RepID=UPI0004B2BDC7|nr:ABC transporter substrate-binding protein [Tomitella biformata]
MGATPIVKGLLAAVAVTLVASACGSGGSGTGGGGPVGDVDRDATLSMAWTLAPNNLDPHQSSNYQVDFNYLSPVYDRLTQVISGPEVAPMLAESWTFADDGMSADFVLRKDATFHDGTKVDAAAVVKSLDRARDPANKGASSLGMVSGVEALDESTVRISTNRKAADLPSALSPTTAAIINPVAIDGGVDLSVEMAGSGPYIADQIRRGDRISYNRYDGYWDPEAQKSAKLEIVGIADDNARLNAFRSGQIDVMLTKAGQAADVETLAKQSGYDMHTFPVAQYYAAQLDIGQAGLEDPRVRQALNYAIDRDGINSALLGDRCVTTLSQPLAKGLDGHDEALEGLYKFDPEKARTLLKDANAPADLKLELITIAGLSPQQEIATVLQAQLKDVGVTMDIVPLPASDAQVRMAQGDMALLNPRLTYPTSMQTLQTNFLVPLRFPTAPSQDFTDAALTSLDPAISDADRTAALTKASGIAGNDAYDVFICGLPTMVGYTDKVVGIDTMGQADFIGVMDTRYLGKTS